MQIMMPVEVKCLDEVNPAAWGDGWKLLAWHTMRKGQPTETTTFWLWRQETNAYCTIDQDFCVLPS